MTLVIGMKQTDGVILASDGYAVMNSNGTETKTETFSKIREIQPGNILVGFSGSANMFTRTIEEANDGNISKFPHANEEEFLKGLSNEMKSNRRQYNIAINIIIGYMGSNGPTLYKYDEFGNYKSIDQHITIGTGTDVAHTFIREHNINSMSNMERVELLIDAIKEASKTPTVSYVPMIAIAKKNNIYRYDKCAINEYIKYRDNVKDRILNIMKRDSY